MQVEAVHEKKEFNPIKLTLTIESAEELYALWHRFNVSSEAIKKCSGVHEGIPFGKDSAPKVWDALNTLVKLHHRRPIEFKQLKIMDTHEFIGPIGLGDKI